MVEDAFSDNELIKQALGGDRLAFEDLYKRYEGKIYNFLYRLLGRREKAEEVTQDTFVSVFRNLNRYIPGKSAAPWIYRIAHNAALNYFRSEKKHQHHISFEEEESEGQESGLTSLSENPEEAARKKEFQKALQKALNTLPEKYRTVLVLHDVEQKSYEEIQEILRIPYQTVATRLARARLLFRKKINLKQFDIHLFMWWKASGKQRVTMLEKWLIKESDLALYVDGCLDQIRSERMRELSGISAAWKETIIAMEETKILLSNLPKVEIPSTLRAQVFQALPEKIAIERSWMVTVANACELVWSHALMMSRVWLAGICFAVLAVGIGLRVAQVESDRSFRVSESTSQTIHGTIIKPGEWITTKKGETVTLNRKELFTLQVEDSTKLKTEQLSRFSGFGKNQFLLETGTVLFKTESAVSRGDFNVVVSGINISNLGTIALIKQTPARQTVVAVLKGGLKLDALDGVGESVVVNELQELTWNSANKIRKPEPIRQEYLEKLVDFSKARIISLGLPEKYSAAALVDSSQISVAFAFFNVEEPDRKALLDEVKYLFTKTTDLDGVRRARSILVGLASRYRSENRLDVSAPIELFSAAISAYLKEDLKAQQILTQIFNNTRYNFETRALAQCALGILHERNGDLQAAIRSYQVVENQFKESPVFEEATERRQILKNKLEL